jgi:hypothetical protein
MKRVVIALTVAALLLVASVAVAKSSLVGSWQTKIATGSLKGTWVLKVAKTTYTASWNGKRIVGGTYTLKANKISLTDKGKGACKGTGVYKYKITGNKLKFTKVSDTKSCAARSTVLSHTFTRVVK